jgi:hypothetical protein
MGSNDPRKSIYYNAIALKKNEALSAEFVNFDL